MTMMIAPRRHHRRRFLATALLSLLLALIAITAQPSTAAITWDLTGTAVLYSSSSTCGDSPSTTTSITMNTCVATGAQTSIKVLCGAEPGPHPQTLRLQTFNTSDCTGTTFTREWNHYVNDDCTSVSAASSLIAHCDRNPMPGSFTYDLPGSVTFFPSSATCTGPVGDSMVMNTCYPVGTSTDRMSAKKVLCGADYGVRTLFYQTNFELSTCSGPVYTQVFNDFVEGACLPSPIGGSMLVFCNGTIYNNGSSVPPSPPPPPATLSSTGAVAPPTPNHTGAVTMFSSSSSCNGNNSPNNTLQFNRCYSLDGITSVRTVCSAENGPHPQTLILQTWATPDCSGSSATREWPSFVNDNCMPISATSSLTAHCDRVPLPGSFSYDLHGSVTTFDSPSCTGTATRTIVLNREYNVTQPTQATKALCGADYGVRALMYITPQLTDVYQDFVEGACLQAQHGGGSLLVFCNGTIYNNNSGTASVPVESGLGSEITEGAGSSSSNGGMGMSVVAIAVVATVGVVLFAFVALSVLSCCGCIALPARCHAVPRCRPRAQIGSKFDEGGEPGSSAASREQKQSGGGTPMCVYPNL